MRVLIVAQGGADLSPLETLLEERGMTVVHVSRDVEVPAAWRAGPCPLVVLDARESGSRMPLVRALRSLPGGASAVVLLVGRRGALRALEPALEDGADEVLAWPPDLEELRVRLDMAERRYARRESRMGVPFGDELRDTMLAVSPVPTSITTLGEGKVVAANDAYFRAFGYTREEMLGKTTVDLHLWERPIDRAQVMERLRRHGSVRGVDAQYHTRTGEVRHTLLFMGLVPYAGEPHVISFFPDITPIKQAEEEVRRSEVSFRTLIQSLPDLVAVFDRNARVRYANLKVARALGYSDVKELVGKHISDMIPPEDFASADARMHEALRTGRNALQERRMVRRDGGILHVESTTFPLHFDGEDSIVSVAHDLTERHQMQARLMLAERMASVGTLAAGVAHEINNPLAYLTANLAFAREELARVPSPGVDASLSEALSDAQAALSEAQQGAERVRTIVRDLKTFSRVDSVEDSVVDVRAVLESTLNLATTEIRHRARLVKLFEDVPPVRANESRLGQVFLNLLVNAAQAIPEGAPDRHEIRVGARLGESGRVLVEVTDTGVGIATEHLPRLFDPFFTTKAPGVGTGLGLSICHNLVTALGGEIQVRSAPGRGSTFRVLLPSAEPARVEPAPPAPRPEPAAPVEKRGRLLVVDDEPLVCTALGRTLRPHHDVTLATRAQDALERIEAGESYDVVFCDLMMPGMSGMDFYSTLMKRHPEQARRVIFLTGGAVTPQARAFLETVTSPHIEKPFAGRELLSLVQERLARA